MSTDLPPGTSIATALWSAQLEAPSIPKTGENSAFGGKTRHVELDTLLGLVVPVLNRAGLVLIQHPTIMDGQPALRTRFIHAESGEVEESTMLLLLSKQDPQGQGSAITYARRYSLMAALGLSADGDDDGNAASRRREEPEPRASRAEPVMASEAEVQEIRDLAHAAGYTEEMTETAIQTERDAHGGVRKAWVETQRPLLQGASGVPA